MSQNVIESKLGNCLIQTVTYFGKCLLRGTGCPHQIKPSYLTVCNRLSGNVSSIWGVQGQLPRLASFWCWWQKYYHHPIQPESGWIGLMVILSPDAKCDCKGAGGRGSDRICVGFAKDLCRICADFVGFAFSGG